MGFVQAKVLEWVAISLSRDLTIPGIEPTSPALYADTLPSEPAGKLVCEINEIVQLLECSLALPFFGIGMKTDLF